MQDTVSTTIRALQMDSKVWSSLPNEIINLIIEASPNEATSSAWCDATSSNSSFYPVALTVRYTATKVAASDLIAPPNAYPNLTGHFVPTSSPEGAHSNSETSPSYRAITAKHVKHNAQDPKALVNHLIKATSTGIAPAHYIRDLALDLRYNTLPSRTVSQVSIQVVNHTLSKLFPTLRSLRTLLLDGPVEDSMISAIADFLPAETSPSFHNLTVRKTMVRSGFHSDDDRFDPADRRPAIEEGGLGPHAGCLSLNFDLLRPSLAGRLKVLEVNELTFMDEVPLAKLVGGLNALEALMVRVRWDELNEAYAAGRTKGPLNVLIGVGKGGPSKEDPRIVYGEMGCLFERLPASLKKLELDDCWFLE